MTPYYKDDFVTLYHGDCHDLLNQLGGEWADVVVTDPPYGTRTDQREEWMVGEFANVMPVVLPQLHRALKQDGAFYCFTSWTQMADWLLRYQTYFKLQNILIWDKERHSGCYSSASWQYTWEGIFFGIKGRRAIRKYLPDVLRSSEVGKREAMQKPVDIIKRLLEASADETNIVLDPFCGTGSTLVAAKEMRLKAVGIEINEAFCETTARRCAQEQLALSSANVKADARESASVASSALMGADKPTQKEN